MACDETRRGRSTMWSSVRQAPGGIDILINCAGRQMLYGINEAWTGYIWGLRGGPLLP